MKNKLISLSFVCLLVFLTAFAFAGCGDDEFPVEVANITINSEPKNIVVLDPNAADIISNIGYDSKMVGRSDEVDQSGFAIAPSVGSASQPDADKIKELETDIVFADNSLDSSIKEQLEENKITVIKISVADTETQLKTVYETVGLVLGGNKSGIEKANSAYDSLFNKMEKVKDSANALNQSAALSTVCYLYYDNGNLRMMTNGTYGDMLLGYTGCVNVAVNIDENDVNVNTLKIANPNYIFYADEQTLEAIKSDSVLSGLTALKDNKTLLVSLDELKRQGLTALETINKMVGFIYPELEQATTTQTDDAKNSAHEVAGVQVGQSTTTATTATSSTSEASKYEIDLKDLSLEYEDDNDNVKAMQQRLFDLGYIDDEENITGYYGDVSKQAVSDFQKNNNIKETGTADNETLVAMFNSDAVKAK